MNLSDIKGEYDVVVGLGNCCLTAEQLRRHNLRTFSGPIDWFTFPSTKSLIKLLKTRFKRFMLAKNLRVDGMHDGNLLVTDTKYMCQSVHDFPVTENTESDLRTYTNFKEIIDRRVDRFYDKIYGKRVLFVRIGVDRKECKKLWKCLKRIVKGHFCLLVVNQIDEIKIVEHDWEIPNVCSIDIYHQNDKWDGYQPHWDFILNGICTLDDQDADLSIYN